MELEARDLMEVMEERSGVLFGFRVVDPCCADADLTGSYNYGMMSCPQCGGEETVVINYPHCPNHDFIPFCFVWYCPDCWLAWEGVVLDERRRQ